MPKSSVALTLPNETARTIEAILASGNAAAAARKAVEAAKEFFYLSARAAAANGVAAETTEATDLAYEDRDHAEHLANAAEAKHLANGERDKARALHLPNAAVHLANARLLARVEIDRAAKALATEAAAKVVTAAEGLIEATHAAEETAEVARVLTTRLLPNLPAC